MKVTVEMDTYSRKPEPYVIIETIIENEQLINMSLPGKDNAGKTTPSRVEILNRCSKMSPAQSNTILRTFIIYTVYINLRRSRDVFVPSFVCFVCYPRFIQFALASFYADCPHKRIIMKVYMEGKNMQLELSRFR